MKYFLFECKKMLKKKSIWVAVILSVVAIAAFYFFNYSVAERVHKTRMLDLETSQIDIPEKLAKDRIDLEEAKEAGESAKALDLEHGISIYEKMLEEKKFQWDNIMDGNWAAISEKQYEQLNYFAVTSKSQNFPVHSIMDQHVSMFTVRASAEERRLVAEIGVEPMVQWDSFAPYHPTMYDNHDGKVLEMWEMGTKRYGKQGFYFLYQVIPAFIIPFIILIGCFVFGNNVSSEATKKRRSLNLYAVLPVKKRQLFFAKYFSGLLFTVIFVVFILCVPLISSLFTSGVGSLQYPVLIYDGPAESPFGFESTILNEWTDMFHFITLREYFGTVLLLTIVLVVFMFSIYYLLSLFIKSPTVNAAILLIVTFFGMTVLSKAPYNPFTYVDIHRVVNREFAVVNFNEAITVGNGLMVLGMIGVIAIGLCYLRFRRFVVE
ncbi:ABC transporter permease subunit [Sporosarcina thermotolerans]|uniref:ABC transporter permease subunit n=1 Tax=Sporosarcina thermotolerans TaxID=633404 RepID=A0AAW9A8D1_9BACL|nr:ABC transporter permease subunit [Sporosarcina thermotolerans]MDW0117702.1 ABC transporter permease subunit [Sporosarcina thermotolerans]